MRITLTTYEGVNEKDALLCAYTALKHLLSKEDLPLGIYDKWGYSVDMSITSKPNIMVLWIRKTEAGWSIKATQREADVEDKKIVEERAFETAITVQSGVQN